MLESTAPLSLLLVEDDPVLRDLISLALQRAARYQVTAVEDGEEALEVFAQSRPQVLLLDILLPRLNGLQLLARLKEDDLLGDTTVVMTSALGYQEVIEQAIAAGARDFLVKPFDVETLLERLEIAIERNRRLHRGLLSAEPPSA
ncbi:MAG: response regulator [Chloroflexi bacterium]|nr:response regulator [Chloroflexota bacterium]